MNFEMSINSNEGVFFIVVLHIHTPVELCNPCTLIIILLLVNI